MLKATRIHEQWEIIVNKLSNKFSDGDILNLDAIIYLIGIQELGKGKQDFSKDDKVNLMHIAVCRLLVPYGYYKFDFTDPDGWPHYKFIKELPLLTPEEQLLLMKEAIIEYFNN